MTSEAHGPSDHLSPSVHDVIIDRRVSKLKNHHDTHPCVNNTVLSSLADLLNQKLYMKRGVLRVNIRNDRYSYNKILLEKKNRPG